MGSRSSQRFNAEPLPSEGDVVTAVADLVHAVASRPAPRLSPYRSTVLGAWGVAEFVGVVEAARYGAREAVTLSARFFSAGHRIAVRVGVRGGGTRHGWSGGGAADRSWLRAARRSEARAVAAQRVRRPYLRWCIEPTVTPSEETKAVLGVYLWRTGLIEAPVPGDWHWNAWRDVLRTPGGYRRRIEDGEMFDVLNTMRTRFALPEDWKQLRKYLARVRRTVQRVPQKSERKAAKLGVSRATLYRWRKEIGDDAIRVKAAEKATRRALMEYLTDALGKEREAARKFIRRHLDAGESVEQIRRRLSAG